eukprot:TRINITY_DN418_c0_g3_i6.p1 TRINITY_DN418_c0_g3~~TRINITY_DN418_c0_g3_i6.p1  ORF type:complete len:312 (+),score=120.57 TRINITY_DN418_c0_g3_i6:104-1039(+)
MAVPWKKSKEIEGVSTASLVGLKAALYAKESELKFSSTSKLKPLKTKRIKTKKGDSIWEKKNSGVQERNQKDKLETLKPEIELESERKLKLKSELYQKYVERKIPIGCSEDVLVDFEHKVWERIKEDEANNSNKAKQFNNNNNNNNQSIMFIKAEQKENSESDEDIRKQWEKYRERHQERDRERDIDRDIDRERDRDRDRDSFNQYEIKRRTQQREAEIHEMQERVEEARKYEQLQLLNQLQAQTKAGREKHQELKLLRQKMGQERIKLIKQKQLQLKKIKNLNQNLESEDSSHKIGDSLLQLLNENQTKN